MKKAELLAEIKKVESNNFLPEAVKKLKIGKLNVELEKLAADGEKPDNEKNETANFNLPSQPVNIKLTQNQKDTYDANEDENAHSENVLLLALASKNKDLIKAAKFIVKKHKELNSLPDWLYKFRTDVDNLMPYTVKAEAKEPKAQKPKSTYKGKMVKDLTDDECEQMRIEVEQRRKKQAKSEKKSKSRPVIEKVAANIVQGAKQAIKNITVAEIKDDPTKQIGKMVKVEAATRKYLTEMRSILGDDYDKDTVNDEVADIHKIIIDLKKKYA